MEGPPTFFWWNARWGLEEEAQVCVYHHHGHHHHGCHQYHQHHHHHLLSTGYCRIQLHTMGYYSFFPSVNVYQSMDSDHPDIQVNMLLYLAMTGVQIKRFLHFLSLCSCINCTIAVKNVPRITIEWTQRTFYLQLREGQGSLLISKLEFFIKADFRGLVFFISRPYAFFYIM